MDQGQSLVLGIIGLSIILVLALIPIQGFLVSTVPSTGINRTVNTLMNFSINNTEALNITQVTIQLPARATFFVNSNGTSATNVVFSNATVQGNVVRLTWTNTSGNALIQNISQIRNFWFNVSLPTAGTNTFTIITNDTAAVGNLTQQNFVVNFAFYGYVKNETGGNASNVNVSIYQFVVGQNGPPTETLEAVTNTSGDGSFSLLSINGSAQMYTLKFVQYNASGQAQRVGTILPPFPSNMYYPMNMEMGMEGGGSFAFEFMKPPSLNGSTFYVGPAATLKLYAHNGSTDQRFGYEVIDQGLGFPVASNIMSSANGPIDVVVPIDRNFTVMFTRLPFGTNAFVFSNLCDGSFMNNSLCPAPPVSNSSLGALTQGQVLIVNQSLVVSRYRLTGCVNTGNNNNTAINITALNLKMVPWTTSKGMFIPPMKGDTGELNLTSDLNYTAGAGGCSFAFYNISIMGSASGLNYMLEVFAKNASNEAGNPSSAWNLAAFQNLSITGNLNYNVTLRRLIGNYQATGDLNTSQMKINIQNATGGAITNNMHVDVKVKNPAFGIAFYIVETLTNGSFYLPILNNSNWAKAHIFSNDAPPKEVTINLSAVETNITLISMSDGRGVGFKKINASGQPEMFNSSQLDVQSPINMRFLRNSADCNVLVPSSGCELTSMLAKNFNPMKAMVAGKVNMEMKITSTNVTTMFLNFDMFSAKQPPMDMVMGENASAASSSSQTWQFGAFVPKESYQKVWIGMPYSDSASASNYFDDTKEYINMTIPLLYDENWRVEWNLSRGDTSANLSDDYLDYNSSALYRPYLTTGGASCNKTDSTLATTPCYINTTGNVLWMEIPHFSGVGPSSSGTSAPAAAAASSSSSSSGGTAPAVKSTVKVVSGIEKAKGLKDNTKLQEALEKVLAKGKLSDAAKENLLKLSEAISKDIETTIQGSAEASKTTVTKTVKYKGKEKVNKFSFYEIVPKSFAAHSDNITVTAPGAKVEIVNTDPEYLLVFDEVKPDQELQINYSVNKKLGYTTSALDAIVENFTSEVYAESIGALPAEKICAAADLRCSGSDLEECAADGLSWTTKQACEFGCENNACKQAPEKPKEEPKSGLDPLLVGGVVVIIVVVLGLVLVSRRKPKYSFKPR